MIDKKEEFTGKPVCPSVSELLLSDQSTMPQMHVRQKPHPTQTWYGDQQNNQYSIWPKRPK
jgi:hypothetical protein